LATENTEITERKDKARTKYSLNFSVTSVFSVANISSSGSATENREITERSNVKSIEIKAISRTVEQSIL